MDKITNIQEQYIEAATAFSSKRAYFRGGNTRDFQFRLEQLKKLKRAIRSIEDELLKVLHQDLKKPGVEAYVSEIALLYEEINSAIRNLKKWMRPEKVKTPLLHFPSVSKIYSEPLGTVLIIGPWNYPFQLIMAPVIGAIAAGNCIVLKPSEETPHTSVLIEKLISETFDRDYISVVQGNGSEVVPYLLREYRFDHIFFTGSVPVGRVIGVAAAEKHISCTLELGGKSPAVIDRDVNLKIAVKRLLWAKFFNSGQTCVSPDYVLVHEDIKADFMKLSSQIIKDFFGIIPLKSENMTSIVNEKRFDTLISYLKDGDIVIGGSFDRESLLIEPTVMENVSSDSRLMNEEIFGPILPVMTFRDFDDVESIISKNPYPLAAYIYTENKVNEDFFRERIQFGGGCVNNSLIHLSNSGLPFGGIGYSGRGSYHGEYSFRSFSHYKSIVKTSSHFDLPVKYPPYKGSVLKFIRKFY